MSVNRNADDTKLLPYSLAALVLNISKHPVTGITVAKVDGAATEHNSSNDGQNRSDQLAKKDRAPTSIRNKHA